MRLESSFISLGDGTLPASFEGLKSHVDIGWIESALTESGVATVRRRKLPAEQAVWLIIGMALYRDRPISEVVKRLDLVLPDEEGKRQGVTNGAVIGARNRIGVEPLENLFRTTARHWALESARRQKWHGLMVLGGDGTTLRVPDSAENRKEFGLPASSRRSAGYPQVRAVGIMALRSHLLLDFAFAACGTSEAVIAAPLIQRVPDYSVTILDRYFINFFLWRQINLGGQERHWLVRARKNLRWKTVEKLGRGDELIN